MVELRLENLALGYAGRPAVAGLTGAFMPGEATAVVGPNGAGKSTLLKGLAGIQPALSGRVILTGASRRDVAYLPQDVAIDRDFPITVADMIALGFQRKLGLFGAVGAADQQRLKGAIEAVGLSGLEQRPIGELSGGQFQRTVFARVIAQDAPIVLLDEPFSAQDARTTADLMRLIRRWTEEGRTLVLVLHDIEMARALCLQTLVLAREAIAWGPTPAALTPETMARATALAEGWAPEAVA